jgi:hypothetical protein
MFPTGEGWLIFIVCRNTRAKEGTQDTFHNSKLRYFHSNVSVSGFTYLTK